MHQIIQLIHYPNEHELFKFVLSFSGFRGQAAGRQRAINGRVMNKLFAVLLGGRVKGCNIELHDIVFTIGRSLEETYPKLVNKWFGRQASLHIDSSIELHSIDGYDISISTIKSENDNLKLFFVNFGGYRKGYFGEVHENKFYIASSKHDVLVKAKNELCLSLLEPHCDDNISVDDVVAIECIDQHYIHLKKTASPQNVTIESMYRRLDLPDIVSRANALKSQQEAQKAI